ncbi:unnamed protein product [Mytilus coruscus]|uniref:Uncharacterized protein n=1 Tax=Mytilus coruscus TaxID=42192 RepID=A0A6J8DAU6_MYTCO|nr:unnamed protein product [Mytilus coruscus]
MQRPRKQKDPDTYDGKHTKWPYKMCHFEQVALWNRWSEDEMAAQLTMCLRGNAQRALSELSREELFNFERLKRSVTQRNRRRKGEESAIQVNIRESLIIEQYISGLPNLELKACQLCHQTSLDREISLALEFEAFAGIQIKPFARKPKDEDISPICTSIKANSESDNDSSQTSMFSKLIEEGEIRGDFYGKQEGCLEPLAEFKGDIHLLMPKSGVNLSKSKVVFSILNPTSDQRILKKNVQVGSVQPIEQVLNCNLESNSLINENINLPEIVLPEHLQPLVERY